MGTPKKKPTRPMPPSSTSGQFRLGLTLAELSDPRGRLDNLKRATDSLRVRLDQHALANEHLESITKGQRSNKR